MDQNKFITFLQAITLLSLSFCHCCLESRNMNCLMGFDLISFSPLLFVLFLRLCYFSIFLLDGEKKGDILCVQSEFLLLTSDSERCQMQHIFSLSLPHKHSPHCPHTPVLYRTASWHVQGTHHCPHTSDPDTALFLFMSLSLLFSLLHVLQL